MGAGLPHDFAFFGSAHPLPLLNDVRVGFLNEFAHPAEGFPTPIPEFGDFFEISSDADRPGLASESFMV